MPAGTHSLATRPGSLVRLTFHKFYPRSDLHRHWTRLKRVVSALDYAGCWRWAINWYRVKDLHPQPSRSKRDASAGWANAAGSGTPGRTLTLIFDVRSVALW